MNFDSTIVTYSLTFVSTQYLCCEWIITVPTTEIICARQKSTMYVVHRRNSQLQSYLKLNFNDCNNHNHNIYIPFEFRASNNFIFRFS